jgi:hypothetical protein
MMTNAGTAVDEHTATDGAGAADDGGAVDEGAGADRSRAGDDGGRIDQDKAAAESAPFRVLDREVTAPGVKTGTMKGSDNRRAGISSTR